MKRTLRGLRTPLAVVTLTVVTLASAHAEGPPGPTFELFGGYVRSTGGGGEHSESYGLRGSYRFGGTWALEGELGRFNEEGSVGFGEVSGKAYLVDTSRFEIYALAGMGIYRIDGIDSNTAHVGLGAEIDLAPRVYLRPEVRGRWLINQLHGDAGVVDYSLGLGWRF